MASYSYVIQFATRYVHEERKFVSHCLVPGPKNPKKCLDIYLQSLIEGLKILWTNSIEAYDVSKKQNFVMRAVLM